MPERPRSSVFFKSNLQPRSGPVREDLAYLSNIWDFALLRELKDRRLPMTRMQEQAYEQTAIPCAYADKGDFPFGTVREADGSVRVRCQCTKHTCALFTTCRPDVDLETYAPTEPLMVVRCDAAAPAPARPEAEPPAPPPAAPGSAEALSDFLMSADPDELYSAFMRRVDPPDSLLLEAEYAAIIWPQDLELVQRLHKAQSDFGKPERRAEDSWRWETPQAILAVAPPFEDPADPALSGAVPAPFPADLPASRQPDLRRLTKEELVRRLLADQAERRARCFAPVSQKKVIQRPAADRAIVNAGPGTGKTWALIERIIALVESGEVAPEEIQVLCYSRAAHEVIVERLRKAAEAGRVGPTWVDVGINTFDSYAAHLLLFLRDHKPEWLPCHASNIMRGSYDTTVDYAIKAVHRHPQITANLRHLLVDEIQDLVAVRAGFLLELASALPRECGFTFFGDCCQAIYDYSVGTKGLRSDDLYARLTAEHPEAARVSFAANKRSTTSLASLAGPSREALLSGSAAALRAAAVDAGCRVAPLALSWTDPGADLPAEDRAGSTMALLMRNNGEVLAVSTQLHRAGIPHELLLTDQQERLSGWIGRLLLSYDGETLDEEDFADAFADLHPEADPLPYWEALTETQRPDRERHEIRDLLKGIRFGPKRSSLAHDKLLRAPGEGISGLYVMTVHRAKGREFDTVLVPWETISGYRTEKKPQKLFEEGRVAYVALTRARNNLRRIPLPPHAKGIHKWRAAETDGPPRWARRSRSGLELFQVGAAQDLDPKSFGQNAAVQHYLLENAENLAGLEVGLQLDDEDTLLYTLADRDRPGFILGATSTAFARDLRKLLPSSRRDLPELRPPDAFRSIYVQRPVTCVSSAAEAPPAARRFGDMAVWLGLEIIGLAEGDYLQY